MHLRILLLPILLLGCNHVTPAGNPALINTAGNELATRIATPKGYSRIAATEGSVADFMQHLRLKPAGSKVHYFNGDVKDKSNVYIAVVDYDIGHKDLLQCADAAMRLRAEYLFKTKQFDKIHFNLTNGFHMAYNKWCEGNRLSVKGNNVTWVHTAEPSNSYTSFRDYLDIVFTYAGSLSLSKEMKSVGYKDMQPGDVFVRGGSPGHCETVIDMAVNDKGEKVFLLAQSYMPAQDIQVLVNNNDSALNPWYALNSNPLVLTPEFIFKSSELMRFERNIDY